MHRTYQHRGYSIFVSVEADFSWRPTGTLGRRVEYIAVIDITHPASRKALTSQLRLGDFSGKAFASEADALLGGCAAARRMIDDLFIATDDLGNAPSHENVNVDRIDK